MKIVDTLPGRDRLMMIDIINKSFIKMGLYKSYKKITSKGLLGALLAVIVCLTIFLSPIIFADFGPFAYWINEIISLWVVFFTLTVLVIFSFIKEFKLILKGLISKKTIFTSSVFFLCAGVLIYFVVIPLCLDTKDVVNKNGMTIENSKLSYEYAHSYRGVSHSIYRLDNGNQYSSYFFNIVPDDSKEYYLLVMSRIGMVLNIVEADQAIDNLYK